MDGRINLRTYNFVSPITMQFCIVNFKLPVFFTDFKCNDLTRKKREIETLAEKYEDVFVNSCCLMGQKPSKFKTSCDDRTSVLRVLLTEKYPDKIACADAFYNCCKAAHAFLGRTSGGDDLLDFVEDIDAKEAQTLTRSSFPESWLYEEIKMG